MQNTPFHALLHATHTTKHHTWHRARTRASRRMRGLRCPPDKQAVALRTALQKRVCPTPVCPRPRTMHFCPFASSPARARFGMFCLLLRLQLEQEDNKGSEKKERTDTCSICSICLADASDCTGTHSALRRLPCGHVFHDVCLLDLVTMDLVRCPNCRSEIF